MTRFSALGNVRISKGQLYQPDLQVFFKKSKNDLGILVLANLFHCCLLVLVTRNIALMCLA
jgi:hypothetical protein